jgi:hypothetical protein
VATPEKRERCQSTAVEVGEAEVKWRRTVRIWKMGRVPNKGGEGSQVRSSQGVDVRVEGRGRDKDGGRVHASYQIREGAQGGRPGCGRSGRVAEDLAGEEGGGITGVALTVG